ncbi:MAG: hypothetical protein U0800_20255 [Isosphaeraceae bacterium]
MSRRTTRKRPPRPAPKIPSPPRTGRRTARIAGALAGLVAVGFVAWLAFGRGEDWREKGRNDLAEGRAASAERAWIRACRDRPSDPIPWRLRLELLRLEDRRPEARQVGREALASVPRSARLDVLKALTLALLADVPDDLARSALRRFLDADPLDADARVALLRRIAADPRPGDPSPTDRLAALEDLARRESHHRGAREALVEALLDMGDPQAASERLEGWPAGDRDARYDRLAGRLALEHHRDPKEAVALLGRASAAWPFDWSTRSALARAYMASGDPEAARREADAVARLREILDPHTLGPRLDRDLARPADPEARRDLADLCERIGLEDLARAWRP